jgi:DNA-directed RNA polymerase subunit M/transcription elongation factor TFIIS
MLWRCSQCGTTLEKREGIAMAVFKAGGLLEGNVTCDVCGAKYRMQDVYAGKFDFPKETHLDDLKEKEQTIFKSPESNKKICPRCGYQNPLYRVKCKNCDEPLDIDGVRSNNVGDKLYISMPFSEIVQLLGEPSGINPGNEMLESGPNHTVVASEETRAQMARTRYCMWERPEGIYLLVTEDDRLARILKKP